MSWPITQNTRILQTGTSLSDPTNPVGRLATRPGALFDQLRAQFMMYEPAPPFVYTPARLGQAAPAAYSPLSVVGRNAPLMSYGVGGRVVSGLASDLAASIYSFAPALIIIEICCNDFGGGTNVTPGGAFQTSYAAVLDGIRTNLPLAKVLLLNETVRGENVAAGSFVDGTNTWAGNTRIAELCNGTSTVGTFKTQYPQFCELVDVNAPALAYCITNNTGGGATRYLTSDALHQSDVGARIIATAIMQHLTFS